MTVLISELLTEKQAAEVLHVSAATLCTWRSTRRYHLRYTRMGRRIFYRREHIQAFIESRTVDPGAGAVAGKRGAQ
jgi:predicted site-specific integrase-resolvase